MGHNSVVREKIFDIYSENIKLCLNQLNRCLTINGTPCNEKFYFCPICYKVFFKDALDIKLPNHLTLEDVPPKSLGGNPKLLTCKLCNNRSGEKMDKQLKWHIEENLLDTEIPIIKRVKLKINEFSGTGTIKANKDGGGEFIIDSYSNSELDNNFGNIANDWKNVKITTNFKMPNPKTVQLALVKIAYLMMCSKFGYGYFYTDSAQSIRRIIYENDFIIVPFELNLQDAHLKLKQDIYYIKSPIEARGYLAKIDLKISDKLKEYYIPISGPNVNYIEYLESIPRKKNIAFEIISLPELDYLRNIDNLFLFEETIWV